MARIVVSGYVVRYPLAGNLFAHLQYVVGFARLGHEVWFLEEAGWEDSCYDPEHDTMTSDPGAGVRIVAGFLRPFGLGERWGYRDLNGRWHGMDGRDVEDILAQADLYLDVGGASYFPEMHLARRRAYVDMDPMFTQLGGFAHARLPRYDVLFTYGTNVGRPGCIVPTLGLDWKPLRPPIVLDLWQPPAGMERAGADRPWTTVATWAAYEEREYERETYGQKDVELWRFIDLPSRTPYSLEIALGGENAPLPELETRGWRLADPLAVSGEPCRYREYIWNSRGELSVAKNGYVKSHAGWFSDRTASYLAAGRPAVVQDTGIGGSFPIGCGLLVFSDEDEAVAALADVEQSYAEHCQAARELAQIYFDARIVLNRLLDVCGL